MAQSTHILLSLHHPLQLTLSLNQVICFLLFACLEAPCKELIPSFSVSCAPHVGTEPRIVISEMNHQEPRQNEVQKVNLMPLSFAYPSPGPKESGYNWPLHLLWTSNWLSLAVFFGAGEGGCFWQRALKHSVLDSKTAIDARLNSFKFQKCHTISKYVYSLFLTGNARLHSQSDKIPHSPPQPGILKLSTTTIYTY